MCSSDLLHQVDDQRALQQAPAGRDGGGARAHRGGRGVAGGRGCLGWPHAVVWVALAVRSLVMPLRQWKLAGEKRPMPPRILGRTEMLFTAAFLITIAL